MIELPEKPVGYTRRMTLHINRAKKAGGHTAFFDVFDPDGKKCDFGYCYTDGGKNSGFTLDGASEFIDGKSTPLLTWQQLRTAYPLWLMKREQATGG